LPANRLVIFGPGRKHDVVQLGRLRRRGVGIGGGDRGVIVVAHLHAVLLDEVGVVADVELDAEAAAEEDVGVSQLPGREDAVVLPVVREVFALEVRVRGADPVELEENRASVALKGVLAAEVDAAAGRVGVHAGGEGVVELDSLDAGDGHLFEGILAAGVVVGRGRGHTGAIGGEGGILRVEAADAHLRRVNLGVVKRDAGHRFHELAHVAHGELAVIVGSDHVLGVHGGAALHDRLGLTLALRRNGKLPQRHDRVRRRPHPRRLQLEVARRDLPGRHVDLRTRSLRAGVADRHVCLACGHARDPVETGILGEGYQVGAHDPHLGITNILLGSRVEHAAGDRAGALRQRERDETERQPRQEPPNAREPAKTNG
jgi:hypothetical protein